MGGQDEGEGFGGNLSESSITLGEVIKDKNIERKWVKSGVEEMIMILMMKV